MRLILANSEAFNASAFSAELTGYAAGYKVPDVTEMLDFIAPPVPVPSRRFEYAKFGDGDFLVDTDDERAAFGTFKLVKTTGTIVNAKLIHRGLTLEIDEDEMTAGYAERAVERLKKRLVRNELYRAALMLGTASANTAKKWMATGTGKSTPDGDIMALVKSVADECGIAANRIICGETAWLYRYQAMVASAAIGEGASAKLTPSEVAMLVGVEEMKISKERYQYTDTSDGSNKKGNLLAPNKVFAFNASKGVDIDDPSTFKSFIGDGGFHVYDEQRGVVRLITVHHYSLLAQTGVGSAKSLTISNS